MFEEPKLSFKCVACDESFNVHLANILRKESIACPNCGQIMNAEAFDNLKKSVSFMSDALKILDETSSGIPFALLNEGKLGFTFSFDWKEKLPYGDGSGPF